MGKTPSVIVLTLIQAARLLGAAATLEKPFDFEVLLSHVRHCLDV